MIIKTPNTIIREITRNDLPSLLKLLGNIEVSKHLARVPHPYTEKDGLVFINDCRTEAKKNPRLNYEMAVELKPSREFAGIVSMNINCDTATAGSWLGQQYWGQGIMTEVSDAMIAFLFDSNRVKRVYTETSTENARANAFIKSIGFRFIETIKSQRKSLATGKVKDINAYELLKS